MQSEQRMSKSPGASPQVQGSRRSAVISDAQAFQMPYKCVVCGKDVSELLSYTQDHSPFIGPGFGLIRTTQVSVPVL
jgi:hypothetical protein